MDRGGPSNRLRARVGVHHPLVENRPLGAYALESNALSVRTTRTLNTLHLIQADDNISPVIV